MMPDGIDRRSRFSARWHYSEKIHMYGVGRTRQAKSIDFFWVKSQVLKEVPKMPKVKRA